MFSLHELILRVSVNLCFKYENGLQSALVTEDAATLRSHRTGCARSLGFSE
jgi:hypothetical protein